MARTAAWGKSAERELPQYWCSSDDFRRWLENVHPETLAPEHQVVYLGENAAWDPSREAPSDGVACCGGSGGLIQPGSLLCCPRCHRSGYERRLSEQRRLAGYPPPERPRPPAPEPDKKPQPTPSRGPTWWRDFALARTPLPDAATAGNRRPA